ncbi:MAG: phosphoglycolate phosphatase [Halobacteriota archaeon]
MFKVKGLAIDIDGTLTYQDRSINCNAVDALRKVKLPIVLATGNISCFARTTAKLIGVSDMAICENGGVVRFTYDGDDTVLGDKNKCYNAAQLLMDDFKIEFLDEEYRKSEVCMRRNFPVEDAMKMIEDKGMGDEVKIVDSGFAYHIIDANVNKGKALDYIARNLNLTARDFVAIGDSGNDLDLLAAAGKGIAVGNADEKLKQGADVVLNKENGEGVIEALQLLELL